MEQTGHSVRPHIASLNLPNRGHLPAEHHDKPPIIPPPLPSVAKCRPHSRQHLLSLEDNHSPEYLPSHIADHIMAPQECKDRARRILAHQAAVFVFLNAAILDPMLFASRSVEYILYLLRHAIPIIVFLVDSRSILRSQAPHLRQG